MKLINFSKNKKVAEAIDYFHQQAPKIIEALREIPNGPRDFSFTTHNNGDVGLFLSEGYYSSLELKVIVKKHWNPFTSAVGWTKTYGGDEIFINARKIHLFDKYDIAGTIGHEFCHRIGFTHGDNKITYEKLMSVPYAFGYLISGEAHYPLTKYRPQVID